MVFSTPQPTTLWIAAVAGMIMVVCLAVPLSIRSSHNSSAQSNRNAEQKNLVDALNLRFQTGYQTAFSAVLALEGFVVGGLLSIPNNTNANPAVRVAGQTFSRFPTFAAALSGTINGLRSFQLQPGGVINQVYPAGSAPIGLDLLYVSTALSPSLLSNILNGALVFLDGPRPFFQGGFGFVLRKLVYNPNATTQDLSTWWGTVAVLVDWTLFLNESGITPYLDARSDLWLLMYTTSTTTIFYKSRSANTTAVNATPALLEGSDCAEVTLPQGRSWTVCAKLPAPQDYYSTNTLFAVIFCGLVGPIVFFAVAMTTRWYITIQYEGTSHAPKSAPFVFSWIGIHRPERLWDLDQHEMERVRQAFASLVRKHCEKVHGYLVEESIGCFAIATRSIDAALHLGFLVGEELVQHPIRFCADSDDSNPLSLAPVVPAPSDSEIVSTTSERRHRLSAEHVRLQCLVHVCLEGTVQYDGTTERFEYLGEEVKFVTRLFSASIPGAICVTQQSVRIVKEVSEVQFRNMPPIPIGRGEFALLCVAIDLRNPDLWIPSVTRRRSIDMGRVEGDAQAMRAFADLQQPIHRSSDGAARMFGDGDGGGGALSSAIPAAAVAEAMSKGMRLLVTAVPNETQRVLRSVFDYHAAALPTAEFAALKNVFLCFFVAYSVLFHPFAEVERQNIFRRLNSLFGVPQSGDIVEHLAVRCAMIAIQRISDPEDQPRSGSPVINTSRSSLSD